VRGDGTVNSEVFAVMQTPDRFGRGVEFMRAALGDEMADGAIARHGDPAADVPSQMLDWSVENLFGFLLQRPGLPLRDKLIAMIGADVCSAASSAALIDHTRWALKSGIKPEELQEICFLLVWYCGMPKVRAALDIMSPVIDAFDASHETQLSDS
jgi:alkylhydroperoxidase/carboxymuconolactone decarboxylase family protein YurZ